jgi:signal transduction protein with GAF and PtsI domain
MEGVSNLFGLDLHLTRGKMRALFKALEEKKRLLDRVEELHEFNPMLGLRGCRLGIYYPEITRMQARAIFEAAAVRCGILGTVVYRVGDEEREAARTTAWFTWLNAR